MRSLTRPFLAALLAVAATMPASGWAKEGVAPGARAPVNQPALKQAPAPQTRSAQSDCVREANRRGVDRQLFRGNQPANKLFSCAFYYFKR